MGASSSADPPVPIAATWVPTFAQGTITFDRPLDQTAAPDIGAFARGTGSARRLATVVSFNSATELSLNVAGTSAPALPIGWAYAPTGTNDLVGVDGAAVAPFEAFTG